MTDSPDIVDASASESCWAPHRWLPWSRSLAALVALGFSAVMVLMFNMPYWTYRVGYTAPWGNSLWSGVALAPLMVVLTLVGLLTASSMRRVTAAFDNAPFDLVFMAIVSVLVTVMMSIMGKQAMEKMHSISSGADIWFTAWTLMAAFSFKPVLDHILEMMHPRGQRRP